MSDQPSTAVEKPSEQSVVRRWKVQCGDMDEIVEAKSRDEAAAKLFTMFDDYDLEDIPDPGIYVSTVEVVGEEMWEKTEDAMKRAGRLSENIVASTAEKRFSESQQSSGSKASAKELGE